MEVLATIPDPEMPISIVDLGLVEKVVVRDSEDQALSKINSNRATVEIQLLPTFVGCPALNMIEDEIRAKIESLPGVGHVKVSWQFDPPWNVDRITLSGRESLKSHGVTVPESGNQLNVPGHKKGEVTLLTSAIACPFCGSKATNLESSFGPTRCRAIYYCAACKNSFEHMKRLEIGAENSG